MSGRTGGGSGAKIRTTGARGGGGLGAAKRIVAMSAKEEKEQPAVARGDERGARRGSGGRKERAEWRKRGEKRSGKKLRFRKETRDFENLRSLARRRGRRWRRPYVKLNTSLPRIVTSVAAVWKFVSGKHSVENIHEGAPAMLRGFDVKTLIMVFKQSKMVRKMAFSESVEDKGARVKRRESESKR